MDLIKVKLWGKQVGLVFWDSNTGLANFEFLPTFLNLNLDIAPLTMPISQARNGRVFQFPEIPKETFYGLPGFLADSLPDRFGNQLIDMWLVSQGKTIESMNPLERLCYIGKRGIGALEFEPAFNFGDRRSHPIKVDSLVELAQMVMDKRTSLNTQFSEANPDALIDILRVGTSAGGARPKAIIAFNEKTKEVRSGQLLAPKGFTHWLMKLDGVTDGQINDPKDYGRIEFAYYKMAIDCGIFMSESRLLEENGRAHFLTRRFDRINDNQKIHVQTLCGLCHYDYNNPLLYSYEMVFQAIRELHLPYKDSEQMYLRMIFNVIANNNDDHTKNISFFMYETGEWRLAPAYDITYAYNPDSLWLRQHQLSINGKRKDFTMDDLVMVGKQMAIKKSKDIIKKVVNTVKNWQEYGEQAGVNTNKIKAIGSTLKINI